MQYEAFPDHNAHIRSEELADYFTVNVSEERAEAIEEHLAECAQCAEEARQWHQFASLWQSWTAQAHGKAYQQAYLVRALQRVQKRTLPLSFQERVQRWLEYVRTKTGAVIRVAVQTGENMSRAVSEGLETLLTPPHPVQPVRVRGGLRTRGGQTRGGTTPRTMVPLSGENPLARVEVRGDSGIIEVHIAQRLQGQRLPLVLLVPMQDEVEPRVQTLLQENASEYYACFEDVRPGAYLVAFEPTP
jgi:hypothetical protein